MKKALIIWGGWDGHQPEVVANHLSSLLIQSQFETTVTSHLGVLLNDDLKDYDVIVPVWSCGISSDIYLDCLLDVIKQGVGLATFHGGINWFDQPEYHKMIGAVYLDDTPPEKYKVIIRDNQHFISNQVQDFDTVSEKYRLVVDDQVHKLAYAQVDGKHSPICWVKSYGHGRVFYSALAHTPVKQFMEMLPASKGTISFFVQSGFPESSQSHYLKAHVEQLSKRLGRVYLGTAIKGGMEGLQSRPPQGQIGMLNPIVALIEQLIETGTLNEVLVQKLSMPIRFNKPTVIAFNLFAYKLLNAFWNSFLKSNQAFDKRFDQPYKATRKS